MRSSLLLAVSALLQLIQAKTLQQDHQFVILPRPNQAATSSAIRDTLKDSKIISQVLDDFEPSYAIDVTYPDHHHQVRLGNTISVPFLQQRPIFVFLNLQDASAQVSDEGDVVYSLILTDPDATSYENPVKSEMCHWIMSNLTVAMMDYGVTPEELVEYMPPAPPKKTGPHRYVFVLLEGKPAELAAPRRRTHWGYKKERHGVRDWAKQNDLKVVGANFFYAQHEKQ